MPLLLSFLCKSNKVLPEPINDVYIPVQYYDAKYEQQYGLKQNKIHPLPSVAYIKK